MRYFISSGVVAFLLTLSCQVRSQSQLHFTPPAPYPIQIALPNGDSLHIIANGNDELHWTETTDGYTILKNKEGYYEYAVERNGKLLESGIRAADPLKRSLGEARQMISISKHLHPKKPAATDLRNLNLTPLSSAEDSRPAVPSVGKIKLLAICIEYPDLPHTLDASYFQKKLNEGVDGDPSFRDYYLENSYGKLDISVDVVGWVKASKNYEYYGDNNSRYLASELVEEAVRAADALGVDYSKYDNDADGDVDAVIVIHSGMGAEEGNRGEFVWSQRSTINEERDNKFIFDFTIQPETRETYRDTDGKVGIGIFCHEFGHLLGLPDLYDTESFNGRSNGIGEWGLMGTAGWLGFEDYPGAMCAWSKERLGWIEPIDITQSYGQFSLKSADKNPQVYRISTGLDNEYFLMENRQQSGFDDFLKGSGLAIWHINTDKTNLYPLSAGRGNYVNGDVDIKGVDLEEADGNADLDNMFNRSDVGDLFPGSSNQTFFNVFSNPTSESYALHNGSTETGISIEDISEAADGTVSFTYSKLFTNGGNSCVNAVLAFEGDNVVSKTPSWFEFTMPKSGSLRISTEDAGRPTDNLVYLACSDNIAAAQATSKNDAEEHIPVNFKYLPKGQKVLIQWTAVAGQSKSFNFKIKVEGNVAQQDSLALVAMYNQMGGAGWSKKFRWLSGPVSSWEGVTVENARVTKLNFNKAGLKGNLPASFYELNALRSLVFEDNEVSGGLDNRLGQLNQLEELTIKESKLTAAFLSSIINLKQLKKLSLANVKLNEGLPATIDQLTELAQLEILNAALTGSIPTALGKLSKLKNLVLSNNQLRGEIPASLGQLWNLQTFSAANNQLSGTVPPDLMTLPALESLSLENNLLSSLPENFFSSNTLNSINLSKNQLSGNLPKTVNRTSTANLTLNLSKNLLNGTLSEALTKINFAQLDLGENQLEGNLPALKVASLVNIAFNRFTSLSKLISVQQGTEQLLLSCQGNKLTFEDLLPNSNYFKRGSGTAAAQYYNPQDTIVADIRETVIGGGSVLINLEDDQALTSNRYSWFLNESPLTTTETGSLRINDFNSQNAGNYSCKVTNTQLGGLTLVVVDIELRLKSKAEQVITVEAIPSKTFGDGAFEIQASSNANLGLTYSRISGPITLIENKVTITGAGEAKVKINQAGNETYHAEEKEVSFIIAKASQTINDVTFTTKVYGEESFALSTTASSGLPVEFSLASGNVTLNNNVVNIDGAGDVVIDAIQEGNEDYLPAASKTIRFSVAKAPQSIIFPKIDDQVYGNTPLLLSPSTSSELPVNLRVVSGPAILSEGQLVIIGAGTVTVEAAQSGNENYTAATTISRTFEVAKTSQEIFFEEIDERDLNDPALALEAFSSVEGLNVNFRLIDGSAEISADNMLTAKSTGKITVEAFQEGNNNYQAADPVQRSFYVTSSAKQAQIIVLKVLPDTVSIQDQLNIEWNVSSDLVPEISISGPALLTGNQLTFTATGEVIIRIEQAGNDEYNAARPVDAKIVVTKVPQVISVSQPKDVYVNDKSLTLQASSDSGLPVLFRIISGEVSLNGNTLTFQQEGKAIIEAFQPGDDRYAAAKPQQLTFNILAEEKLAQTISFNEIPNKAFGVAPFDLQVSSSSKLPLTLEVNGPATLDGLKLSIQGAGQVTVLAYQQGDENYSPSDTLTRSFNILPAAQTLEFELKKITENIYLLHAESDANLPVSYEVVKGEAEIKKDTLFVIGEEHVEIKATQEGNENYAAAEPVSRIATPSMVTSIDEQEAEVVKISPNPSDGIFHLDLGKSAKQRSFSIYDAKGRLIKFWENQWPNETVDLSNQAAGVYLLNIQDKDKTLHFRLIKQ